MATETAIPFLIMPALVSGLIIGIYEIILVHRDVQIPTHRFSHGVHGLVFAVIASFAVFNVPFVLHLIPAIKTIPLLGNALFFRIAIGLVMMIKIHGVSAAIRSNVGGPSTGLKETWAHSAIVAALVIVAPYIFPFIAPTLPKWMVK